MSNLSLEKDRFGQTAEGVAVDRYTLRNSHGAMVRIITFGATVTELWMPDRQGALADVVLGFDDLGQYEQRGPYFGAVVGRVAFRIAGSKFELDGTEYPLTSHDGSPHLHGGARGFSHVVWQAEPTAFDGAPAVKFTYRSPDGDQGYPGALDTAVVYSLTEENELRIEWTAITNRPTLVNLAHHGYFNLAGAAAGNVLGHQLWLDADRWIPAEQPDLPSGKIAAVEGTPYDFTRPTAIGARIGSGPGKVDGYDLCYLHNHPDGDLARVASVFDAGSGRALEVLTTEPAVVLYTADYLDGTLAGKKGVAYPKHAGVCLETGRPPDAVHHPHFPSTTLRPGETYRHTCIYRFAVKD